MDTYIMWGEEGACYTSIKEGGDVVLVYAHRPYTKSPYNNLHIFRKRTHCYTHSLSLLPSPNNTVAKRLISLTC